jgi:RNA polymerase sigma factor (sigma-70 family)
MLAGMHRHHRQYVAALDQERADRMRRATSSELAVIVHHANERDRAAWAVLVDLFTGLLRSVARRHRLSTYDVDDVMQETWLRLLEHGERIREPARIAGWLETVARRESLDALRAGRGEIPMGDDPRAGAAEPDGVEDRVASEQRQALLDEALGALPHRQAALLELLFSEDEPSYPEISARLNMPIGSIGPTRQRGLDRLRSDHELVAALQASR